MIHISKPYIGEEEKAAVLAVLESGMLAQGAKTLELESAFAGICATKHAIATSSGTTALQVALLAHGIEVGDEVITTSFTFIATINSILSCGATPVLVDIEADTFNINPEAVAAAISPRTRAILPVHLYGYPCNMAALQALAEKHNLVIVEDAAQAVGAEFEGRRTGRFGTGCFSLYATKNVMSGEGGMITTDDDQLARRCRMIRSHGMERRYYHDSLGYNYRISDLHAAIGVVQTGRLAGFNQQRAMNADYLSAHLRGVITPTVKAGYHHVWHQYTVRVPAEIRDSAVERLQQAGVGTGIFYPVPAHKQAYLEQAPFAAVRLPVTEALCGEVFSLPVHPQLSSSDLEKIVYEVNRL